MEKLREVNSPGNNAVCQGIPSGKLVLLHCEERNASCRLDNCAWNESGAGKTLRRGRGKDALIVGMWPPGLCFCNGLVFLKCCEIPEARRTSVMINNITREAFLGRSRVPMRMW